MPVQQKERKSILFFIQVWFLFVDHKQYLKMKKATLLPFIICLIISCEKSDNTCNCKEPLDELSWLRDLKNSLTNCTCEMSIIQATYNRQTVFFTSMTDPLCDGIINIGIADCSGKILKTYTAIDEAFETEVTDRKVLYRCSKN